MSELKTQSIKVNELTTESTNAKIKKFLEYGEKKTNRIEKEFSEGFNYTLKLDENMLNSDCKETPKIKVLVNSERAKQEIKDVYNLDFSEIESTIKNNAFATEKALKEFKQIVKLGLN
jgi:hypothetical protein